MSDLSDERATALEEMRARNAKKGSSSGRRALPAARGGVVVARACSPCGRDIVVELSAKCAESPMCQYAPSGGRTDGRCEWHGQLHDYKRSGDRDALFNRGLCGEDEIGPRIGQLCSLSMHHEECPVGIRQRERAALAKVKAQPPSRHDLALGRDAF